MRSTAIAASALAYAASATAQIAGFAVMSSPAKDEDVPAGSNFNVKWSAGEYTGPVDLTIMSGQSPETLQLGNKIASGVDVTSNQFSWAVDCSLGKDATYGIKITSQKDESVFQYSFPFHIDNTNCGNKNYGKPGGESGGEGGGEGGKEAPASTTTSSTSKTSAKTTTVTTTSKTTTTSKATTTTTSKATTTTTSKATTTATTKGGYGGGHPGGPGHHGGPFGPGGPKGPGYWSSDCETTTPPPPAPTPTLVTSVVPPPAAPPAPVVPTTAPVVPAPEPTTPAPAAPPSTVPVSPASRNAVASLAVIVGVAAAAFAL